MMPVTWTESLMQIRATHREEFASVASDLASREDQCVRTFFIPMLDGRKERAVLLREEGEWITATLMGWIDGFFAGWSDDQLLEHLRRAGQTILERDLEPRGVIIAMQGLRELALESADRLTLGRDVHDAIQTACMFAQHEIQNASRGGKNAPPPMDNPRWKASVDEFIRITRMNRIALEKDLR